MNLIPYTRHPRSSRRGFTLAEVIFASALSVTVLLGATTIYLYVFRSWYGIEERIRADSDLNTALNYIIYGLPSKRGIRAASSVNLETENDGWNLRYVTGTAPVVSNSITYSESAQTMILNPGNHTIGKKISSAEITVQPTYLTVKLEAEREKGKLKVKRELETDIYWRN